MAGNANARAGYYFLLDTVRWKARVLSCMLVAIDKTLEPHAFGTQVPYTLLAGG